MTFEEKLNRAKSGSRAAYESLCLDSADKLFTAALISLKTESEARGAVIAAVNDGASGITRIRDERHLRSWLVHELTKNTVDRLKALKASGTVYTASGVFAETGKLPDVERLVFAVWAVFGYGEREISVLTGMSGEAVAEKLRSARQHLGTAYGSIIDAAAGCKAPASLRERFSGFDEAAAAAESEIKQQPQDETPEPRSVPEKPQGSEEQDIAEVPVDTGVLELPENIEETVFSEEETPYDENDGEPESEETDGDEQVFEPDEPEDMPLNAETFIAVVSAEKMKGSEFLRLIGNTRISNSAYHEIEQNPRLTKKRLIELLEQSQLTENDYYKLLTAIKDRREVLDAKEENRLVLERAGLYDGSRRSGGRRRHREKPKTELEMAIGITDSKPVQPLTFEESKTPETDIDYQLQNSKGTFSHPGYYHDHKVSVKENRTSLEAAVKPEDTDTEQDSPMSHAALHDLFDEHNDEPIDPFAAIAANETGIQSKPDRIDIRKEEWEKADKEKPAEEQPEPSPKTFTLEFDAAKTAEISVDTRPFDAIDPDAQPAPAGFDPFAHSDDIYKPEETDDQPEIVTTPVTDGISVTQIIRDHAIGEKVTDEQADISLGIKPDDVMLTFERDGGTDTKETESLEFTEEIGKTDESAFTPVLSDGQEPVQADEAAEDTDDDEVFDLGTEEDDMTPISPVAEGAMPVNLDVGTDLPGDDDDDEEDDDEEPEGSFDEAPRRRYKGNEYFIDDNEYYEGVNRGKIAACAVFASLLIAGCVGMKLIPQSSAETPAAVTEQTEEAPAAAETAADTETLPAADDIFTREAALVKLASLSDLTTAYDNSTAEAPSKTEYLSVTGAPFDTDMITDIGKCGAVFTDTTAYIYSRSEQLFRAVNLTGEPEEPAAAEDAETAEAAEPAGENVFRISPESIYACTAIDGDLYVVCAPENVENATCVRVFAPDMSEKDEYLLSGVYCGAGKVNGRLVTASCTGNGKPYYAENGYAHDLEAADIYAIEGAKHGAVHLIYEVGGSKPLAIAGGTSYSTPANPHVSFGADGITLVTADGDVTYTVDITNDLTAAAAHAYKGCAFSADCAGHDGMIGADAQNGLTAYKNGRLVAVPDVTPISVAWSEGGIAYVVARQNSDGQKMLYGFDMSGSEPVNAGIAADDIYTSVLRKAGNSLAGVKAEPSPDGERAGLRLSLYSYDGKLTETAYSIIELDRATARENLKYLSSPAETDIGMLAADEKGTLFAVPTVYFDGFSEVERVVVLSYDGTTFTQTAELVTYDEKSPVLCPYIRDGKVYVISGEKITEIPMNE
ncbi:MAG: hypothetical protein J6N15_06545 [Ruminiclostridium sp.]|nr:hypothetical protein [Ruminiclostridium sp.]